MMDPIEFRLISSEPLLMTSSRTGPSQPSRREFGGIVLAAGAASLLIHPTPAAAVDWEKLIFTGLDILTPWIAKKIKGDQTETELRRDVLSSDQQSYLLQRVHQLEEEIQNLRAHAAAAAVNASNDLKLKIAVAHRGTKNLTAKLELKLVNQIKLTGDALRATKDINIPAMVQNTYEATIRNASSALDEGIHAVLGQFRNTNGMCHGLVGVGALR